MEETSFSIEETSFSIEETAFSIAESWFQYKTDEVPEVDDRREQNNCKPKTVCQTKNWIQMRQGTFRLIAVIACDNGKA